MLLRQKIKDKDIRLEDLKLLESQRDDVLMMNNEDGDGDDVDVSRMF